MRSQNRAVTKLLEQLNVELTTKLQYSKEMPSLILENVVANTRSSIPISGPHVFSRFRFGGRLVSRLHSATSILSFWRKLHRERSDLFIAPAEIRVELIKRGLDVEGELKKPFWMS